MPGGDEVTEGQRRARDGPIAEVEQRLSVLIQQNAASAWLGKTGLRDQTNSIRESLVLQLGDANAEIEEVRTVAVGTQGALATFETTVTASFASTNASVALNATSIAALDGAFSSYQTTVAVHFASTDASVNTNATAIATLGSSFSSYQVAVNAHLASTDASVSTNATAIASLGSSFSSYQTTVNASLGSLSSSVTTHSSAIATLNGYAAASWGVTLDVNGYAVGFNLVNGGAGVSAATFTVEKFQIAYPTGGYPAVPIFTVANVNGSPKVALRGDMIVDGSVTAGKIFVGSLTAISAHFGNATVDGVLSGTSGGLVLSFTDDVIIVNGT